MPQIVDSYSESNYNVASGFDPDQTGEGQTFTGDGGTLNSAKFYLRKLGSPTGNIVAKIYSHSGTFGTDGIPDTLLATSDNVDVATLSDFPDFSLITFTFSGDQKITLDNGVYYCLSIEYSGSDYSLPKVWGGLSNLAGHLGNSFILYGGTFYPGSYDYCFYVYKDDTAAANFGSMVASMTFGGSLNTQ